jgi:hypothetical protein
MCASGVSMRVFISLSPYQFASIHQNYATWAEKQSWYPCLMIFRSGSLLFTSYHLDLTGVSERSPVPYQTNVSFGAIPQKLYGMLR